MILPVILLGINKSQEQTSVWLMGCSEDLLYWH